MLDSKPSKPTIEQIERMQKIWSETPLCNLCWVSWNFVQGEPATPTKMCPISALIMALPDKSIVEKYKNLLLDGSPVTKGGIWSLFGDALQAEYGINFKLFDAIILRADQAPVNERQNDGESIYYAPSQDSLLQAVTAVLAV